MVLTAALFGAGHKELKYIIPKNLFIIITCNFFSLLSPRDLAYWLT